MRQLYKFAMVQKHNLTDYDTKLKLTSTTTSAVEVNTSTPSEVVKQPGVRFVT